MKDYSYLQNNAVWGNGLTEEYNCNLAFCYSFELYGNFTLKLTCSGIYRLTVNGKFIGYGPARTAHGYSKVDEYSLFANGKTVVVAETVNYNVNSYYLIKQSGYFTALMESKGKIIAVSDNFTCYLLNDRIQKVQRFTRTPPRRKRYGLCGR